MEGKTNRFDDFACCRINYDIDCACKSWGINRRNGSAKNAANITQHSLEHGEQVHLPSENRNVMARIQTALGTAASRSPTRRVIAIGRMHVKYPTMQVFSVRKPEQRTITIHGHSKSEQRGGEYAPKGYHNIRFAMMILCRARMASACNSRLSRPKLGTPPKREKLIVPRSTRKTRT